MKQLRTEFDGRGEMKGFTFTQIMKSDKAYIYEVSFEEHKHYEVFEHKENHFYDCVSYPSSNSFGLWAFCFSNYDMAMSCFEKLSVKEKKPRQNVSS